MGTSVVCACACACVCVGKNQSGDSGSVDDQTNDVDEIKSGSLQHQSHSRSIGISTCACPYVDLMMQQLES